jgi:hypothetical protein
MYFRKGIGVRLLLLALLAFPLSAPLAQAAGGPKGKGASPGRPPNSPARTPEEKRSAFEAWKKQRETRRGVPSSKSTQAPGGAPAIVGRAGMGINAAGTIIYTQNFRGSGATCDPNERSANIWAASTAFAAGAVVRPTGFFGANGFQGFNFQANNAGTSGAVEPTWPTSGVGATVVDGTITWHAIGFDPADFVGCLPMQIVSRASGGAETTLAREGDALADGSQLSGWAEFMGINASGMAAFRAAQAGVLFTDRDDEGQSGIFTVGPGAGALTRVAQTGTTIGGRNICGMSSMVNLNDAGQVVFDTYVPGSNPNSCDENNHGIVRFTPGGPGNQLLVQQGSSIGTPSSAVIGFGNDDNSGAFCSNCEYESIDGFINSAGHVPVVVRLADGTQGVFNFTGPLAATQVVRLPAGSIGPRVSINNNDQLVYRAVTGGVQRLFRFTPPGTITTIVSVGDVVGGNAITSLGAFTDINNGGHVVYQGVTNGQDAYYFWNGSTSTRITTGPIDTLASEMIAVNDNDQVAYVTGTTSPADETDGGAEGHEDGGVFIWTQGGGSVKQIQVGDVINANTVTSIYAEHTMFPGRQFSEAGCIVTAYHVLDEDEEFDCTEGGTSFCGGGLTVGGLLFSSCATGGCPTITVNPPTLPAGTQGLAYSQQLIATGGQAPYTFAVTSGTPPPGINVSAAGLVSGTPTATGTFNFLVTATDANTCTGARAYSLVIGAPTQVTIALSPGARTIVVGAGGNFTAIINIAQGTPTVVTLTSANPSIVTVPPTVTIPAGQTSAPFTATGVTVGGPVTITATLPASFNATPATAAATVVPAVAAAVPTLSGWAMMVLALSLAMIGLWFMKR